MVVEDCFTDSGLGTSIKSYLFDRGVSLSKENFISLWPVDYHMCADSYESLYDSVWMSREKIIDLLKNKMIRSNCF